MHAKSAVAFAVLAVAASAMALPVTETLLLAMSSLIKSRPEMLILTSMPATLKTMTSRLANSTLTSSMPVNSTLTISMPATSTILTWRSESGSMRRSSSVPLRPLPALPLPPPPALRPLRRPLSSPTRKPPSSLPPSSLYAEAAISSAA
ncbi:hypothetical protein FA15DRAFT_134049 [Coprinopsis marcescibilis]|uniref:Uncharacterized protein n=1 Tax=Coprinopsis marcescibilis TaxID=230819 RepID=A0A5C3L6R5_COPMA|nr:hypothetical protein FA15DRAFT_134049 [Coprinopsis marcescibilis]